MATVRATRFSGAEWADQLRSIFLVGVGGIGSWLTLNLARIGHTMYIIDPDDVDESNVTGGQMYKQTNVGQKKVHAVQSLCRELGTVAQIVALPQLFDEESGMTDICITGLDNMEARKLVYNQWKAHVLGKGTDEERKQCFFLDGRLTMEMYEVIAIHGDKPEQMARYEADFLFDDGESNELDCTTKQSTFAAMGIASLMTATLCGWLENRKLEADMGMDMRDVPMYQRMHFPMMDYRRKEADEANESVAVEVAAQAPVAAMATVEAITEEVLPGNTSQGIAATVLEAKAPSESFNRLKSQFI